MLHRFDASPGPGALVQDSPACKIMKHFLSVHL